MVLEYTSRAMALRPDEHRRLLASLPAHNATRWTAVRKARVVAAVVGGALTLDEARSRYALSLEEFMSWQGLVTLSRGRSTRPSRPVELSSNVAR